MSMLKMINRNSYLIFFVKPVIEMEMPPKMLHYFILIC